MKRKAYLLLELLIAFSLLALCSVPLIRNPLHAVSEEIQIFERAELERLAVLAYASLYVQLVQNQIPWEKFQEQKKPSFPLFKDEVSLKLEGTLERKFRREFYLWSPGQQEGKEGQELRLVKIQILFAPIGKPQKEQKIFEHIAFVERKKKSIKAEEKI